MKTQTQALVVLFSVVWITVVMWRLTSTMHGSPTSQTDKVCMNKNEYDALQQQASVGLRTSAVSIPVDYTRQRDIRVLSDPLYPALARTDRSSFEGVAENTHKRNINIPSRSSNDTYRLVGYLSNEDADVTRWKVFARQKDRNRSDFYITPVDRTIDMKIQITDGMTVGEKMRDVDTVPDVVQFNSPLLSKTPYTYSSLPKADLIDEYL
jgi:hypothetical protein